MFLVCLSRQCSIVYPMNQTVVLLLTIIMSNRLPQLPRYSISAPVTAVSGLCSKVTLVRCATVSFTYSCYFSVISSVVSEVVACFSHYLRLSCKTGDSATRLFHISCMTFEIEQQLHSVRRERSGS